MRKNSTIILGCALALVAGMTAAAWAELSPDEIAKLGTELTPLGGVKAGNADGTIPAWDGGLATPPAGWQKGTHFIDPFADDEVHLQDPVAPTAHPVGAAHRTVAAGRDAALDALPAYTNLRLHGHAQLAGSTQLRRPSLPAPRRRR